MDRVTQSPAAPLKPVFARPPPDGQIAKFYPIAAGDLIVGIDGKSAHRLGSLAVLNAFNDAYIRPVPIAVVRGSKHFSAMVWRSGGSVPTVKATPERHPVTTSNLAPNFSLPSAGGGQIVLSNLRGQWTLITFWATWCASCVEEAPFLSQLKRDDGSRLNVVAVALGDKKEKISAFITKTHPEYTIVDGGSLQDSTARVYGITGMPSAVLVSPDGAVAFAQSGYDAPSQIVETVGGFLGRKG